MTDLLHNLPAALGWHEDTDCDCGESNQWHTDEAHGIEDQIGPDALADFERAHSFEYTS